MSPTEFLIWLRDGACVFGGLEGFSLTAAIRVEIWLRTNRMETAVSSNTLKLFQDKY